MPNRLYTVEVDGVTWRVAAESLAEVCSQVRGEGERIKVWAPSGLQLIDTEFGDEYNLVRK